MRPFILLFCLALAACVFSGGAVAQNATWIPRSSCPANATLTPPSVELYNETVGDLFGWGDLSLSSVNNFLGDVVLPFILTYGIFFWAGLFGVMAVGMFVVQENVWVPISLTLTGGLPIVVWQLPYDWQKGIGIVVILGIAGLLYALRKKRGY